MTNATPLILAVETSGKAGSTALVRGEEIVAEHRFDPAMRGGSVIAPGVARLLEAAGSEAIGAVAVGIGPGSYTGTRIGVVYAKTFAYGRKLPLFGVTGLQAVAARAVRDGRCVVAAAAHETRVYGAIYDCVSGRIPVPVRAPELISLEELQVAAGRGAHLVQIPPESVLASDIGRIAALRFAVDPSGDDAVRLEPLYLQLSPPERKAAGN